MKFIKLDRFTENRILSELERRYDEALVLDTECRRFLQLYNAAKSRLADQQYWDSRPGKIGERMTQVERECALMHFAASRLALQAMSRRIPALTLPLAKAVYRVRLILIQSGTDEHTRRLAMNNFVVASDLYGRLTQWLNPQSAGEWNRRPDQITDGGEALAELHRFRYRLDTDRCFMQGLQLLFNAFGYRNRIEQFLDLAAFGFIPCNRDADPRMQQLEVELHEALKFIAHARGLLAEIETSSKNQQEKKFKKRKEQVSLDPQRLQLVKDEQAKVRAELASLKIEVRNLHAEPICHALLRAREAFHCDRTYPDQADLTMVNNLVYVQAVLSVAYDLKNRLLLQFPLDDDLSFIGLQDRYNAVRNLVDYEVTNDEGRQERAHLAAQQAAQERVPGEGIREDLTVTRER
jgi:hypothetical protein